MLSIDSDPYSGQVEYTWGSQWSIVKVLYFIVRYYTAITLMCVPPRTILLNPLRYATTDLLLHVCPGVYVITYLVLT